MKDAGRTHKGTRLKKSMVILLLAVWTGGLAATDLWAQKAVEASEPQGVTVSIYDTGIGVVNEARRAVIGKGESTLVIRGLPAKLEASSASLVVAARNAPFDLLEQSFQYDFSSLDALLQRMQGQPVIVDEGEAAREGFLMARLLDDGSSASGGFFPVRSRDGRSLWMVEADRLSAITFPFGRDMLATEPQLVWKINSIQEGPQNFRLSYRTEEMAWRVHYEIMLAREAQQADFNARVELINRSGGRYDNARVRLLLTEKGMAAPILPEAGKTMIERPAMRYPYGSPEPAFERSVAALTPLEIYELPRTVTMEHDRPVIVQLARSAGLPVRRVHVYDGVRFDRFQRNRRTDWNYGTESHGSVETHVEFENADKFGLGISLPPGLCRLYQLRDDGAVDLVGEEAMHAVPVGANAHLRVGPAVGLVGERVRTGYVEVRPHHEYDESFQVSVANLSEEDAEIRVVEHLYRWPEFEIVRADTDYKQTGPQDIEFLVALKPGGRRTIHYTVRYIW